MPNIVRPAPYVVGIEAPSETWLKMRHVYDACIAAGIRVPDEVESFFGGEPDAYGPLISLNANGNVVKYYKNGDESLIDIYLNNISSNIKIIRFVY